MKKEDVQVKETLKHSSQKEAAHGYGGKFGVMKERQDKVGRVGKKPFKKEACTRVVCWLSLLHVAIVTHLFCWVDEQGQYNKLNTPIS